jgi:DNA polymerase V
MQKELAGETCYPLEYDSARRKSLSVSRSFRTPVTAFDDLSQALALYISRGAEKLRLQESFAENISVYVMTSRFKSQPFYYNSKTAALSTPSSDTPELIKHGKTLLKQIFQSGKEYTKTGVIFSNLVQDGQVQLDLFDTGNSSKQEKLMQTMDKINVRMGSQYVRYASIGLSGQQSWKAACNHRSSSYTTDWDQLLSVR